MRTISAASWNVPGGSDGPQMLDMRGYHGSRMYVPVTVASPNMAGSALARNPLITHVWAPYQATMITGECVASSAVAASRSASARVLNAWIS